MKKMKTLDEVIKNLEDGTEHLSAMLISRETWSDTLHYLQEYKAKMKVLEYKSKRYDEMCETIQKQGQEHEDRCQAEIARYQEAVRNCEEAENKYRKAEQDALKALDDWASRPVEENKKLVLTVANPPLTWDELKQMEGKPVWVEESAENGLWWTYWVIWECDNAVLPKKDYSTKWKAYRKERHEG